MCLYYCWVSTFPSKFEVMSTSLSNILQFCIVLLPILHQINSQECLYPETIDFTVQMVNCDQPYFFNFLPKTEENMLLDNICVTFMTLPDDPNIVIEFDSFVYCDGSNYVQTLIMTPFARGTNVVASPLATYRDFFIGYAGCDTYIGYRCSEFGDNSPPYAFGVTTKCSSLGLSCLRKVKEVMRDAGLPEQDMYLLPNKLPNRCVVQSACSIPHNPFFNKLHPSIGLVY